jgi:hypothetical protein
MPTEIIVDKPAYDVSGDRDVFITEQDYATSQQQVAEDTVIPTDIIDVPDQYAAPVIETDVLTAPPSDAVPDAVGPGEYYIPDDSALPPSAPGYDDAALPANTDGTVYESYERYDAVFEDEY